jgi:two-component system, response regulator, stage 0 sporulation protein F
MARILVIDDDVSVRRAIKIILERKGHTVICTECGHHGVAATEIYAFELVIVDIFMPGLDGIATIKAIHRLEPAVKILAISGCAFGESDGGGLTYLEAALDVGADACLRKPFGARELLDTIGSFGALTRAERASA